MRLAFRLVPGDGESPSDFASRLATLACRDSLWGFCKDFGLDHQGIVDGSEAAVRELASLADVDAETLLRSAFLRIADDERYRYRGELLVRQNLSRYRVRFCPACIAEDLDRHAFRKEARPFRRGEWAINVICTCNCHRLRLVNLPPEKSPRLCHDTSWAMARALPDLSRFLAQAVSRDPSPFEGYVRRRLSGERTSGWLDALPLYAALQLVRAIGEIEFRGTADLVDGVSDDFDWRSEACGFEIFDRGEAGILDFLGRKRSVRRNWPRPGRPPMKLGRLYQWLFQHNRDLAYDPMRQLMLRIGTSIEDAGTQGDALDGPPPTRSGSDRWHSAFIQAPP